MKLFIIIILIPCQLPLIKMHVIINVCTVDTPFISNYSAVKIFYRRFLFLLAIGNRCSIWKPVGTIQNKLPHNYLAAITLLSKWRLSYKTGHILCLRKSEDIFHILKHIKFNKMNLLILSSRFGTKHHWMKGIQVKFVQMKDPAIFQGEIITK